jgi:hypothetical protein
MERRQPWMKFFWQDWRSDPNLRASSLAARGLWADMIGIMHDATPYGHLLLNAKPLRLQELAAQVGRPLREVKTAYDELASNGVYSVNEDGVVFSRRMVRSAERSAQNAANGSRGGRSLWQSLKPPPEPSLKPSLSESAERIVVTTLEARSQNPKPLRGADEELASELLERYPEIYARCRSGAVYRTTHKTHERDYSNALALAQGWPNLERLIAMLEIFLKRTDFNAKNIPGTPGQFLNMAPDCDRLLREHGR